MEWLLLFILGPPILTLILRILIFIVRYGPGFVGAIFDLICCVLGLVHHHAYHPWDHGSLPRPQGAFLRALLTAPERSCRFVCLT